MRLETLDRIVFPNLSIRIMGDVLDELGLDTALALKASGVLQALIDDPAGRVSGQQELAFQHAFVALTGHAPEVWFRTGLRYRMLTYGAYGFAMMTARTLRRSLEFSHLFGDLHYSLMNYQPLIEEGALAGVSMDPSPIPEPLREFSMYRALGSVTTILHDIWQGSFPLTSIETTLPAPRDSALYARELRAPVAFGATRNAWLWPTGLGDQPLPMGSVVCEETYERQCAEIIERCRTEDAFVHRALNSLVRANGRYLTAAELAGFLAMSERTLQRRLAEHGLTYRSLLDQVRYQHARELLETTKMTIEQVALELAYSEGASFTRAFSRWAGMSPSAYRNGQRLAEPAAA